MSRCSRSSLHCDDGSPIVDNTYDLPVAHERRQMMLSHHLEVFIHIKGKGHSCTSLLPTTSLTVTPSAQGNGRRMGDKVPLTGELSLRSAGNVKSVSDRPPFCPPLWQEPRSSACQKHCRGGERTTLTQERGTTQFHLFIALVSSFPLYHVLVVRHVTSCSCASVHLSSRYNVLCPDSKEKNNKKSGKASQNVIGQLAPHV